MKIGILSDIHGNHHALLEVLKEAKKEKIQKLLVLGDVVGYYYHPEEVLSLLSEWDFELIRGNHEDILTNLIQNPSTSEEIRKKYGSGHRHALEKLSKDQLELLRGLPETKAVQLDGISILMSHGSPWSSDLYLYPDTREEVLSKFDLYDYDFILVGHSHYAFCIKRRKCLVVNPGSVGQSRQKGGKAYWAVLNTSNRVVEFRITDFSVTDLVADVLKYDDDVEYNHSVLKRE